MGCSTSNGNHHNSGAMEMPKGGEDLTNERSKGMEVKNQNEIEQNNSKLEEKPMKPPKPIPRKKSSGHIDVNKNNSRYMQINQPVARQLTLRNQRPHSNSSPMIPSSSYIGHLSRPYSNTEDSVPIADGRTPSTNNDTDPELLTSIRASAAQKRAASKNSSVPPLPPKVPEVVKERSTPPRQPFTTSLANTATPKTRKSTGSTSHRRAESENGASSRKNRPSPSRKSRKSFLERARKEGRSPGELELIETIEREIVLGKVDVSWDSIGGLKQAKDLLQEAVVLPQLLPDYFQGIRRPWKGVLMFGPPGTGKTMLAKAVASECSCTFLNVSASTLGSKWRGESEKLVRILFEIAAYYSPSTIFIDEIDSIAGARGGANEHESSRRVKTELMVQMDGMNSETTRPVSAPSNLKSTRKSPNRLPKGSRNFGRSSDEEESDPDSEQQTLNPTIIVIAATNTPWDLDEALRRRFEKRIYIPLPDLEGRTELFRLNMKSIQVSNDVNYEELGQLADGYTGADISNICRDAAMMGMRRFLDEAKNVGLSNQDIQSVLKSYNFNQNSTTISLDVSSTTNPDQIRTISLHSVVTRNDFLLSLRKVNKSINGNDLKKFENWMNQYGSS